MKTTLRFATLSVLALAGGCSDEGDDSTSAPLLAGAPTLLVDLDPASAATTFTIENITAHDGMLFMGDRESGDILRVDPRAPTPVVVGRIPDRTGDANATVKGNAGGLTFNTAGDLLIATGPFNEVVRLPASDLSATTPGDTVTFATGTQGANALLLDDEGRLYVSGGNSGNVYRVGPGGGAAAVWAQIPANTRSVPPDNFMQSVVSNGLAFDPDGALLVADTSRGAIWQIAVDGSGNAGTPEILVQDARLEGVDGITYDPRGRLWAAVNERNCLLVIEGRELTIASQNDIDGPLEFPAAVAFIGNAGYVANYDRPRGDNLAEDGTSLPGIGSSILRFGL